MINKELVIILLSCAVVLVHTATWTDRNNANKTCSTIPKGANKQQIDKLNSCKDLCIGMSLKKADLRGNPILSGFQDNQKPWIDQCSRSTNFTDPCVRAAAFSRCIYVKETNQLMNNMMTCSSETGTPINYYPRKLKYVGKDHCYHRCMYVKMNFLKTTSALDVASLKNMVVSNATFVDTVITKCGKITSSKDKCAKETGLAQCIKDNIRRVMKV